MLFGKSSACVLIVLMSFLSTSSSASVLTVFNKQDFLQATNAQSLTGVLPNLSYIGSSVTIGSVGFQSINSWGIWVTDFVEGIPGNEIGLNDLENLDVAFQNPMRAFGFDFFEPSVGHNAPYVDSTFTVSLFNKQNQVGSFTFNAPDGILYFVGVISTLEFDNVKIRESIGGIENEFFGQFYGESAKTPEPTSIATVTLLLSTLFYRRFRFSTSSNN